MTEIAWRSWDMAVFEDAKAQNKPVLLSISAVWCQFCRNMDEQTYQNDAIGQYIADNFIAVRVDSDKRPDINARYTMGGWPTTAVLSPEGDVIWGGTFVPPADMAQLLPQILNAYHHDKQGMANHIATQRQQLAERFNAPPHDASLAITPEVIPFAVLAAKHNFDFAFGGFGREQKFAHQDAIELCLQQYSRSVRAGSPDADLFIMVVKTLAGMANGQMRDPVGGFFRYTQTPDWQGPRFEKLLEDNAILARLYAHGYQLIGEEGYREVAAQVIGFLNDTLYDSERGIWGGSQAADDEYYAQPLDERGEWNPPPVDGTVLCGANAQAVRAMVSWWAATGDTDCRDRAKRCLDFLLQNLIDGDGLIHHYLPSPEMNAAEDNVRVEGPETVPSGLLADAADLCAACLDGYEAGFGANYLDAAERIAGWVQAHLDDPLSGGFFDMQPDSTAIGNLKAGAKDFADNMLMVDSLLRLFLATGEDQYAQFAQRTLQAFLPTMQNIFFALAASYALAVERAMRLPVIVHILGQVDDPRTLALLQAAQRPYRYERFVQLLDPTNPDDAEHIGNLEYPQPTEPTAHISLGMEALEPITDPELVTQKVATMVEQGIPLELLEGNGEGDEEMETLVA